MSSLSTLCTRAACLIAFGAICITFPTVASAQDMNQLSAQMHKVTDEAKAKQAAQAGSKNYSIQSTSNIDTELNTFVSTLNAGLACAATKTAFQQQNTALIDKAKEVLGLGQQFQSNALLRAAGAGPLATLLQAAMPIAKSFVSVCQNFTSGMTAGANTPAPKPETGDPRLVACAADVKRENAAFQQAYSKGMADGKIDASEKADLLRIEAEAKTLVTKAMEDKKLTLAECQSIHAKVIDATHRLATALASGGKPDPRIVSCVADLKKNIEAFNVSYRKGQADGKIDASERADIERLLAEEKELQRKAAEDKKLTLVECTGLQGKLAEASRRVSVAVATNGPQPGTAKYEQVATVMKQVFTGGDLSPTSRAVKHAADVDMPARGGNPEALKTYLNSQNGTVKSWYKSNFGLSYAEAPAPAAGKYDQVSAVMKQVFTGGDLGPNSAAVKHAADVDMPARGGSPEALKTYLLSQNGTVKNWYMTNYGLR